MQLRLDDEERELFASVEREEWHSSPDFAHEADEYRGYAAATLSSLPGVRVELTASDLEQLQQQAQAAGLSRETLIARIVHQYVSGELVERT